MKNKLIGAVLLCGSVPVPTAYAQDFASYPIKPVRVIVGLAPGGATDVQARWFAQKLSESMGKQFVIDNRSGAGGMVAFQLTAHAPPDGYTLVAGTPAFTIAPALQNTPSFDPIKDFTPISLLTKAPFVTVVIPSLPVKNIRELIAFAKTKPGELIVGVSGRTSIHMGAVWLGYVTGSKFTIVPYKGNAPVLTDMLGGQVHATLANMISALPLLKTNRLRALAVTTLERSSAMPDLPTIAESGVPGYDVSTWHGWLAPKGTPPALIKKLADALAKAVKGPGMTEKLADDGALGLGNGPEPFKKLIADEIGRWKKLVDETGLQKE